MVPNPHAPCQRGGDEEVLQGPGEVWESPQHQSSDKVSYLSSEHVQCSYSWAIQHVLPYNPQAIQRRLNEIEATMRELETEGMKLELALRKESSE